MDRANFGLNLVNKKGKPSRRGKRYLGVIEPLPMFEACEYEDSYQQLTLTILASGTYEASKIKSFLRNVSQYEQSLDYINR